jgi:hypothetical protein
MLPSGITTWSSTPSGKRFLRAALGGRSIGSGRLSARNLASKAVPPVEREVEALSLAAMTSPVALLCGG